MLDRTAGKPGCPFVACLDVIDARATAKRFLIWQPILRELGLPVALVVQDGQEDVGVPWDKIDAKFVSGSTEFKLGPIAASIAREAKRRAFWVHCDRVTTRRRLRYASELGCDSVDGSGLSAIPAREIPNAFRWLDEIERQPSLLV